MANAPGQTALALGDAKANPARSRGLRRAGARRAPCEPPPRTELPALPTDVEFLALLTRVRATRIATGELSWTGLPLKRLYDIRAFKTAWAEHAYVYQLAAGGRFGGTAVTSMPQLVRGLARFCHPTWELTDDEFVDRDRYHTAVRPRLRNLQAMGLLDWRIGTDDDGEERRTELVLRQVPELMPGELEAAAKRLARWEACYGPLLNTGSQTGVIDAPVVAAPLAATERAHRAITRVKRRREARLRASENNCAPPFGAGPTAQNHYPNTNLPKDDNACVSRSRVTRPRASNTTDAPSASTVDDETTSLTTAGVFEGKDVVVDETSAAVRGAAWLEGFAGAQGRVAAREQLREPLLELIASHAARRAAEVATWRGDRGWPLGRLREAWVVARRGAGYVAEFSPESRWGAGPMQPDDLERLRRAVRRYERHRAARPEGYPKLGLAALLHIAELAAAADARPETLHYGIMRLEQESVSMRAAATGNVADRRDHQADRAHRRVVEPPPVPGQLAFRRASPAPWPAWVSLDRDGAPIIVNGELQIRADATFAPAPSNPLYRQTLRDAYLLAGKWAPLGMDGRADMAADPERVQRVVDEDGEHTLRARPGPYFMPRDRTDRLTSCDDAVAAGELEHAARGTRAEASEASRPLPIPAEQHHPECPCKTCSSPPPDTLTGVWEAICGELRRAVPDTTFEIWLAPLTPQELVDGRLVLGAPDTIRSWVSERFAGVLHSCAATVLGAGVVVDVVAAAAP